MQPNVTPNHAMQRNSGRCVLAPSSYNLQLAATRVDSFALLLTPAGLRLCHGLAVRSILASGR